MERSFRLSHPPTSKNIAYKLDWEKVHESRFREVLRSSTKARTTIKINQLDYTKLKSFCTVTETVTMSKKTPFWIREDACTSGKGLIIMTDSNHK